jgi:hypothetical protein
MSAEVILWRGFYEKMLSLKRTIVVMLNAMESVRRLEYAETVTMRKESSKGEKWRIRMERK